MGKIQGKTTQAEGKFMEIFVLIMNLSFIRVFFDFVWCLEEFNLFENATNSYLWTKLSFNFKALQILILQVGIDEVSKEIVDF